MRLVSLILLLGAAGCGTSTDLLSNENFAIDCAGQPCDWVVRAGSAGQGSWHDGDVGLDLSGEGEVIVEQRSAGFTLARRELDFEAAIVRDPSVSLSFELAWYAPGTGVGATFWERDPELLDTRAVPVVASGTFRLETQVATPSLEAEGLVLRVIKEGSGRAIVDELVLGAPEVRP
jgi:hypothetical protein